MSGLSAKGEVATEAVLWTVLVVAGIIMALWFSKTGFNTLRVSQGVAQQDLLQLQLRVNRACFSNAYDQSYNPFTEEGFLIVNDEVCVSRELFVQDYFKVTRCFKPLCRVAPAVINLTGATYLRVVNNGTVFIVKG